MATPQRVKDLLPGSSFGDASQWTFVGDRLFFRASDGDHGSELWVSDGTTSGTVLVADVWPGPQGSIPTKLTGVGNTLFFVANDGVSGEELWATDVRKLGTEASTVRLGDLLPGPAGSSPSGLTPLGNTLFFIGGDPIAPSLWRSDGTPTGTVQITPTPANPWGHFPSGLTLLGNSLLFSADFDNGLGRELWISDGTTAGTVLLKDLWPGSGDSNPSNLTVVGTTAFFCASDPIHGRELWKTDGTAAGTVRVTDIQPGLASSNPSHLIGVGNRLFFTAGTGTRGLELWMTDGTAAGTAFVQVIQPGPIDPVNLGPYFQTKALGNTLLFTGDDGTNGIELWRTDGTSQGTVLVRDIWPGQGNSRPNDFTVCNDLLYFSASDPISGRELWRSDGTEEGTFLAADLNPGAVSSSPTDLTAVGNLLLFNATNAAGGMDSWSLAPDPFPSSAFSIKALAATQPEGQSGSTPFTFLIRRSGATDQATAVHWDVSGSGDHPADRTDFIGAPLSDNLLSFGPGQTSRTLTLHVVSDTTIEPDETFRVSLSPTGADTITIDSATGRIVNDDDALSQAVAAWKQGLDQVAWANVSFTNLVGGPNTSSVYTISLPFRDGSRGQLRFEGTGLQLNAQGLPVAGTVTKGTLSKGGSTLAQNRFTPTPITSIFGVVVGDLADDGRVGEPTLALLRSNLDLRPVLSIAAPPVAQVLEGTGSPSLFLFSVARAGDISVASSVRWSARGSGSQPANAADFLGPTVGTLTFAPWVRSQTLTVAVNGDTAVEANETFAVSLSNPTAAVLNPVATSASATIRNDDTALAIAPLSASKPEGNRGATAFTFTVTRTGVTRGASSALWAVSGVGETGATGADFLGGVFPAGSVSFGPGQTSCTLTIAVAGDTVPEANNSFHVTLSAPTGATLGSATAKGTILNDDPLPSLNLTALNPSLPEGNEGQTFFRYRLTRSGNLSGASSVQWGVSGLGSLPANAADFIGGAFPAGRLTFAAGEASKTLTLAVAGDTLVEANESFKLSLSAPLDANLGVATANGMIANDDTALSIAPLSAVKAEGRSGVTSFTFVIQRSGITTGASSVRWSVKGSGAAPTVVGPLPYRSFADSPLKGLALPRFDLETFEDGLLNTPGVTITNNQPGGSVLGVIQPSFYTDSVDADDGAEDGYGRNGHSFANLNNDGYESFGLTVSFSPTDLGGWPTSAGLVWTDGSTTAPTLFEAFDSDGQLLGSLGPVQIGDAFFDGTTGEDRFFGVSSGSGIAKLTIRNPGGLNNLEIDHVQFGLGRAGQAAANAVDFLGATTGTVTFAPGQTSRTLTVTVRADSLQELDDTFTVSLSAPTGATLGTGIASGTIRNDDWIGDAKANTLVGTELADVLDGRTNVDLLTGKGGADLFVFRFASSPAGPSDSPLSTPDRIMDFAFGADKIALLSPTGTDLPKPTAFSRAANNSAASSLAQLTAEVFVDANGARLGHQPLVANGAVLVQATNPAIAGTYLLINNGVAGRSELGDLLIQLSGISGPLPALGLIAPDTVFA